MIYANPNQIAVLDHGFVKLRNLAGPTRRAFDIIDSEMGARSAMSMRPFDADDMDVPNAARLSFEGQDQERSYDVEMKLARYLAQHHHDTPFEIVEVWLEMKLPIFVARQFVRQRTMTINEASARYITLPEQWYIPAVVGGKAPNAKQGQEDNLDEVTQGWFRQALQMDCENGYALYKMALARGVAPEHARMFLHVNHYTHWMMKMNLRNLMFSFLRLRYHSHAQVEAQAYAKATFEIIEPHLPGLMAIYQEFIAQ